jgi:DNA-binding PadR family transcriptional regulator
MADPLTPAVFHILLALAGTRLHGYAISKEILRQTDGQVRMGPGTLYGTLRRLLDLSWVEVSESPEDADERRRYYRLTGLGKRALQAEVHRMDALVRAARNARIKIPPPRAT